MLNCTKARWLYRSARSRMASGAAPAEVVALLSLAADADAAHTSPDWALERAHRTVFHRTEAAS